MRRTLYALGFLALSLIPVSVGASDIPVRYRVDDKALRAGTPAGTPLVFTLYSDAGCTQQLYQATVSVENVTLISKLKLATPKGARKMPATDEIQATLTGVVAAGNVYLKVTGPGIKPSGQGCEAQTSLAAGELPTIAQVQLIPQDHIQASVFDPNVPSLNGRCIQGMDQQSAGVIAGFSTAAQGYRCDLHTPLDRNGFPPFLGRCYAVFAIDNCVATAPSCADGIKNQDEADVDCGGSHCNRCVGGESCQGDDDCYTACSNGRCTACSSHRSDCGGPCPGCGDADQCDGDSDCASAHCLVPSTSCYPSGAGKECIPAHCFNGIRESDEADVDCGGNCHLGCSVGKTCNTSTRGCQVGPGDGSCDCTLGHHCTGGIVNDQCTPGVCSPSGAFLDDEVQ